MNQIWNRCGIDLNIFNKINVPTLIQHMKTILSSEPEDTHIQYKFYTSADYMAIAITLKNKNEGYSQLHYFYMDSVDKKSDEYLYFTMSLSNLKCLMEHTRELLTT